MKMDTFSRFGDVKGRLITIKIYTTGSYYTCCELANKLKVTTLEQLSKLELPEHKIEVSVKEI